MITDASKFQPSAPRRLVPADPEVPMRGPGSRFAAGVLVDQAVAAGVLVGALVQLADRRR